MNDEGMYKNEVITDFFPSPHPHIYIKKRTLDKWLKYMTLIKNNKLQTLVPFFIYREISLAFLKF